MTHETGVISLPVPGTKNAPKKFTGRYDKVKRFVQHYEKLCAQKSIIDDQEKVENITQYCSRAVREFMEGLSTYTTPNWTSFIQDLYKYYDADRDTKRYKVRDLEEYIKKSRKKSLKKLSAWKTYSREYIRIAGWLKHHDKITNHEEALYFWKGIPKDFRAKLEGRLLAAKPDHDLATPFASKDVAKVAESILQRNRFDMDRLLSDDDSDSDDESTDSDNEDSSDESDTSSDSDVDIKPKKKKTTKKRTHKKKHAKPADSDVSDDEQSSRKTRKKGRATKPVNSDQTDDELVSKKHKKKSRISSKSDSDDDDLHELIDQLNKMSIDDPTYALLYYRVCKIDAFWRDILKKPTIGKITAPNSAPPVPSRQAAAARPRDPPPHMTPSTSAQPAPAFDRPAFNRPAYDRPAYDRPCYGCGIMGHTTFSCAKLIPLLNKGVITRLDGQYCHPDGSRIERLHRDETIYDALMRKEKTQAKTNYISVNAYMEEVNEESEYDAGEDTDDEDAQAFPATYPATRTEKGKVKRKEVFDGVHMPSRREVETKMTEKLKKPEGNKENLPTPKTPAPYPVRTPTYTPVDVHPRTFDPDDSDAIMEDVESKPKKNVRFNNAKAASKEGNMSQATPAKRTPKQSEVQTQVDQLQVLGKVLSTPVTLAVGEIIGISKEMAHHLQDVIKPKIIRAPNATAHVLEKFPESTTSKSVASTFLTRTRGPLIRLQMECDGNPITAIIDTGSQLNIAHERIWKAAIRRPKDTSRTCNVNDANGGESLLRGLVPDVPLSCGGVMTHANLFIGDHVPFDLLLGRPWQRGNYVSIDERADGTYLLFKDRDLEVRFELMVTNERFEPLPEQSEYLAHVHSIESEAMCIHVTDQSNTASLTLGLRLTVESQEEDCASLMDVDEIEDISPDQPASTSETTTSCDILTSDEL